MIPISSSTIPGALSARADPLQPPRLPPGGDLFEAASPANVPGLLPNRQQYRQKCPVSGISREPPAWLAGPLGLRTDVVDEEVCEDREIQGAG